MQYLTRSQTHHNVSNRQVESVEYLVVSTLQIKPDVTPHVKRLWIPPNTVRRLGFSDSTAGFACGHAPTCATFFLRLMARRTHWRW